MMELAMNTRTADIRIGSQRAVSGTMDNLRGSKSRMGEYWRGDYLRTGPGSIVNGETYTEVKKGLSVAT
jgi:hypothetical protein